ncbi:MAG: CvpA family protein [Alphaproteobacteria bacterium]
MVLVDGVILVLLGMSMFIAFWRGFVREMLTIASWIGGVMVTLHGFSLLHPFVVQQMGEEGLLSDVVTAGGLFIGSMIIFSIFSFLISESIHKSSLSALDRSLGAMFGLARGSLLACMLFLLATSLLTADEQEKWFMNAKATRWLQVGSTALKGLAPKDFEFAALLKKDSEKEGDLEKSSDKNEETALLPKGKNAAGKNSPLANHKNDQPLHQLGGEEAKHGQEKSAPVGNNYSPTIRNQLDNLVRDNQTR